MAWWKMLVLMAALFSECNSEKPLITNGHDAKIEAFPYQVSLRILHVHFCSGSILSERHVLTATYCIKHLIPPYTNVKVVTGVSHGNQIGHAHKIDKIQIHSNYSINEDRTWNDIAIITLKEKIFFDEYQQKVDLPEHNPEVGQNVTITGWRWAEDTSTTVPTNLKQIQTQLASNQDCQKKLTDPETTKIEDTEICTLHAVGSGPCMGDAGAPLAADGVVLGIYTWFDGEYCPSGKPVVYTNVYKFLDFIESAMEADDACIEYKYRDCL